MFIYVIRRPFPQPICYVKAFVYVHEANPLASHVKLTLEAKSSDDKVEVQGAMFEGFSGCLRKVENGALKLGVLITAPKYPRGVFQDVDSNHALNAIFEMPSRKKHESVLLPGEDLGLAL